MRNGGLFFGKSRNGGLAFMHLFLILHFVYPLEMKVLSWISTAVLSLFLSLWCFFFWGFVGGLQ